MPQRRTKKIDFKAYRKAVIDVAKYHKGQTLNKDEMFDFWYLVERAYRHYVGMSHVFRTRKFTHNSQAIAILKRREMITIKTSHENLEGRFYTFSGGTDE